MCTFYISNLHVLGPKESWLVFLVSEVSLLVVFDNISQKKKYILQVAIIQNLTPKHCSTEILLIIFSTKKWTKKKTSGTLITSAGVLQLCTRTFDVIQSSSRSTALCWIAWIFFEKKSPQLQGRSLLFRTLGFFFTENTSSSLKVDETKGNYEGALGRATPPKFIGKLILNHPPLFLKSSGLDCGFYLSRDQVEKLQDSGKTHVFFTSWACVAHLKLKSQSRIWRYYDPAQQINEHMLSVGNCFNDFCDTKHVALRKYILIMLNRLKPNTSETWRASENWHSTTGEHPWHSRHGKNACIHHGAFYTSHEDDEDVRKTAHNSKKVPFNLLGFSCHPTN